MTDFYFIPNLSIDRVLLSKMISLLKLCFLVFQQTSFRKFGHARSPKLKIIKDKYFFNSFKRAKLILKNGISVNSFFDIPVFCFFSLLIQEPNISKKEIRNLSAFIVIFSILFWIGKIKLFNDRIKENYRKYNKSFYHKNKRSFKNFNYLKIEKQGGNVKMK